MISNLPGQREAKSQAKRLRRGLAALGFDLGHAKTLDLVAVAHGARNWNTLAALTPGSPDATAVTSVVIPMLRDFDWEASRSFYLDFLGWTLVAIDQAADHAPRYVQLITSGGARVHLSEHHGDGTPGSAVLIEVSDLVRLQAELAAREYGYAEPALAESPLGSTMTVHDPSGNRITFLQPQRSAGSAAMGRVADELPPIIHELNVDGDPEEVFQRFTSFAWWRDYGLDDGASVIIEGAEVIFRNPGGDMSIGTVTDWQPGHRYAQTFTLAQDADHPTTLSVEFRPHAGGTLVRLEHGGWKTTNADRRGHFTDWPIILGHFAAATV